MSETASGGEVAAGDRLRKAGMDAGGILDDRGEEVDPDTSIAGTRDTGEQQRIKTDPATILWEGQSAEGYLQRVWGGNSAGDVDELVLSDRVVAAWDATHARPLNADMVDHVGDITSAVDALATANEWPD